MVNTFRHQGVATANPRLCQLSQPIYTATSIHHPPTSQHSLSINTSIRIIILNHPRRNTNTVLIAPRIRNTSRSPNAISPINAVRASNEIIPGKLEMILLIDSPPGTLGVPRGGLGTSCIADLALACLNENSSSHTCCIYARN